MGVEQGKHAFVVAGTHSGCGKTTISLALMGAFAARGLRVQPFKIGPDFIDPGLHARVAGRESRSLDGWMLSREYNRELFHTMLKHSDIAVIEGVMGLYDGYDGTSEAGSSAQMAKWLGLPVMLIVDARSMARSAAALVLGFSRFDADLPIAGVVFNRVAGEGHLNFLKQAMASNLPDIPVLGGIPREESIVIPERHLGLVTADEFEMGGEWQNHLVRLVERHLDLDLLLERSRFSPVLSSSGEEPPPGRGEKVPTVAVARDAAFCFYYPDNLELLRRAGARVHLFSPLAGETLPPDAAGLYLGGGYPEVFAEQLSAQKRFMSDVRSAVARGMPTYAECGGLMALSQFIQTIDGKSHPMAGILPFATRMLSKRKALGYTEVALRFACHLGAPGLRVRGHEFHYSEIMDFEEASSLSCAYELRTRKEVAPRLEGYLKGSVLASYVHLHWGSEPRVAANFVQSCVAYQASLAAMNSQDPFSRGN